MRTLIIVATLLATALHSSSSFVLLPNGHSSHSAEARRLQNEIQTRVNPIPRLYDSRNDNSNGPPNGDASIAGEIARETGKLLSQATKAGANFLQKVFKEGKRVATTILDLEEEEPVVDTEDEELFQNLFLQDRTRRAYQAETTPTPPDPMESKIYVKAEVLEGVRVIGTPGKVIDAEIINKRFL